MSAESNINMDHRRIRWRLGVLAAIAIAFLALYPQILMWVERDKQWHGSYTITNGDEWLYSAYINALIDGRPRRSDPYTGRDDLPNAPQPESLFSIQFVPAYAIALPARALGASASTVFIALMIIAAFASSLAIFWLITSVAGDDRLAAIGVLVVLCFGALAGAQGLVRLFLPGAEGIMYTFLPFLRRYQPSATFPLFFVLCALVWHGLIEQRQRAAIRWAILAGLVFGALVFSYFYLWTAAAAWLACLALLWLVGRPAGWQRDIKWLITIGLFACGALVPYFILLSHRSTAMDSAQILTFSRMPDLFRAPELIGAVVFALLACGAWRGTIDWRSKAVLFTASLALMPFVVFNQQIITGRSLQPFHYELFIANYVVLVAVVMATALLWRGREEGLPQKISRRAMTQIALIALFWGGVEVAMPTKVVLGDNRFSEDAVPIYRRLAELAGKGKAPVVPRAEREPYPLVFCTDDEVAIRLPTFAPQGVLWSPNLIFSQITETESKERFYQYLYYSGIDEQSLAQALEEGKVPYRVELFGHERVLPDLTANPKPITREEVATEVRHYKEYAASFTSQRAAHPTISYVVTPAENEPDWSNLDRWYERDGGESWGKFKLYRVQLRSWNSSPAQHSDNAMTLGHSK